LRSKVHDYILHSSTSARARTFASGHARPLTGHRAFARPRPSGRHDGRRAPGHPTAGQQRQAAERDARQDGRATPGLRQPDRVAEHHRARDGADQRLQVEERPGDLGRHAALAEREQGERQQRPGQCQRDDRQHDARAGRPGRRTLAHRGDRQRAQRRAQERHGSDRDRVAAGQQPALGHRDHGRQEQ
jgi:hypothetical protein